MEENKVENNVIDEQQNIQNDGLEYGKIVEDARLDLVKVAKKGRTKSNIMMLVICAIIVASMIMIGKDNMALKIAGWSLVGAGVIGMIVFYALTKNKLPEKTKAYIKTVNETLNNRNFNIGNVTDVQIDPNEKLELADITCDSVYNGTSIGSRNVVHGMYDKRSFTLADLALFENANSKNRQSSFVGKYISYPNDLHFEGRIVLVYKSLTEQYDQPDNVSDLEKIFEDEKMIVYAQNEEYKSILGEEFLNRLSSIVVSNYLLNISVVIWSGHSAIYLSYADEVISLPYEKPFQLEANEQYRSNLIASFEALSLLKK